MLTFYGYSKCDTCRKAQKHLKAKSVAFQDIDITTNPPPKSVLAAILKSGDYSLKDLFNKSGEQYRALQMKDKISKLPESELLDLLAGNGRLVKRPIVTDGKRFSVGFYEARFRSLWG